MASDQREGRPRPGTLPQYGGGLFLTRIMLGCVSAFVLMPLLLFAGWFVVDRLDSSEGTTDPVLEDRLQQYLGCIQYWPESTIETDSSLWSSWWRVTRDLGGGGFRAQVDQVSGWDQIVILAPQETGALVADDPTLTSWWLRRRVSAATADAGDDLWGLESMPANKQHRILIIRDQAVVGDFSFEYAQTPIRTALVSRWPPPDDALAPWLLRVLWVLALLGLVLLARRIVAAFGWTRSAIGCIPAVLILLGLLALLLDMIDWPYKVLSPLHAAQAVGSRDDPANRELVRRLESAVCGVPEGRPLPTSAASPQSGAVVVDGPLPLVELRERASRVPGWDQLVVIGAKDSDRLVANDPTLETTPLREAVRQAVSWSDDALKTVLVVRNGQVVGELTLEAPEADFWSCVVERAR